MIKGVALELLHGESLRRLLLFHFGMLVRSIFGQRQGQPAATLPGAAVGPTPATPAPAGPAAATAKGARSKKKADRGSSRAKKVQHLPKQHAAVPALHSLLLGAFGLPEERCGPAATAMASWQSVSSDFALRALRTLQVLIELELSANRNSREGNDSRRSASSSSSSRSNTLALPVEVCTALLLTALELQALCPPDVYMVNSVTKLVSMLVGEAMLAGTDGPAARVAQHVLQLLGPAFLQIMTQATQHTSTGSATLPPPQQLQSLYADAPALFGRLLRLLLEDGPVTSTHLAAALYAQPQLCCAVLEGVLRSESALQPRTAEMANKLSFCASDIITHLFSAPGIDRNTLRANMRAMVNGQHVPDPESAVVPAVAGNPQLAPPVLSLLLSCSKVATSVCTQLAPWLDVRFGMHLACLAKSFVLRVVEQQAAVQAARSSTLDSTTANSGHASSSSSSSSKGSDIPKEGRNDKCSSAGVQQVGLHEVLFPWLALLARGLQSIGRGFTAASACKFEADEGDPCAALMFATVPSMCQCDVDCCIEHIARLGLPGSQRTAAATMRQLEQQQAALRSGIKTASAALEPLQSGKVPGPELAEWAEKLEQFGVAVAAALPLPGVCNNPDCVQLGGCCEAELVKKRCSVCKVQYCSADCQQAHWLKHKKACKRLGEGPTEV